MRNNKEFKPSFFDLLIYDGAFMVFIILCPYFLYLIIHNTTDFLNYLNLFGKGFIRGFLEGLLTK